MDQKIHVAILGATGLVGQVFVRMLHRHPWFEPVVLCASDGRIGERYGRAVRWSLPWALPRAAAERRLAPLEPEELRAAGVRLVFSALPADVAAEVEPRLRAAGFGVFSNAGALRHAPGVPILIPEVNPADLSLIETQGYPGGGFVVTNANCSTTGLALALAPLRPFGLREVFVSTYQSVSGAGSPGLSFLESAGNVLPHIPGEEEKIRRELGRILGEELAVYPSCVRVPVPFGHLETVWLRCREAVTAADVVAAWRDFGNGDEPLPSGPRRPVVWRADESFPQPRLSFRGRPPGMAVTVGRVRVVDGAVGFTLMVNNLVRGAAGGAVINAEAFRRRYGGDPWARG